MNDARTYPRRPTRSLHSFIHSPRATDQTGFKFGTIFTMADDLIGLFQGLGTDDHDVLLEKFCRVLKCEERVAKFFLESAKWNVEVAVNTFISTVGTGNGAYGPRDPPRAAFDAASTIPQGTNVPCNKVVQVSWRFKNVGNAHWPSDTRLVHTDGETFGFEESVAAHAAPGAIYSVIATLTMPSIPGNVYGQWRLTCGTGYFGDPVWVIVSVCGETARSVRVPQNRGDVEGGKDDEGDGMDI